MLFRIWQKFAVLFINVLLDRILYLSTHRPKYRFKNILAIFLVYRLILNYKYDF